MDIRELIQLLQVPVFKVNRAGEVTSCSGKIDVTREQTLLSDFCRHYRHRRRFAQDTSFQELLELLCTNRICQLVPRTTFERGDNREYASPTRWLLLLASLRILLRDQYLVSVAAEADIILPLNEVTTYFVDLIQGVHASKEGRLSEDIVVECCALISRLCQEQGIADLFCQHHAIDALLPCLVMYHQVITLAGVHALIDLAQCDMGLDLLAQSSAVSYALEVLEDRDPTLCTAFANFIHCLSDDRRCCEDIVTYSGIPTLAGFLNTTDPALLLPVVRCLENLSLDYSEQLRLCGVIPQLVHVLKFTIADQLEWKPSITDTDIGGLSQNVPGPAQPFGKPQSRSALPSTSTTTPSDTRTSTPTDAQTERGPPLPGTGPRMSSVGTVNLRKILAGTPSAAPSPSISRHSTLTRPKNALTHPSREQQQLSLLRCTTCACLTSLSRYDINAVRIQQCNGIYVTALCLLRGPWEALQLGLIHPQPLALAPSTPSGSTRRGSADLRRAATPQPFRPADSVLLEQAYALRLLRFLFSVDRNRRYFKRLFPPDVFSWFISVGHYEFDLSKYRAIVKHFYRLTISGVRRIRNAIEDSNIDKTPSRFVHGYGLLEKLGAGSFGAVYRAYKKGSDITYAVKEIALSGPALTVKSKLSLANEARVMQQLSHPNVVRYFDCFEIPENQSLYIVMEMVEGASLMDHFNSLAEKQETMSEPRIWKIFVQICNGVHYIHTEKQVVHRDLSPANVMIGWFDKVIITDFGLARQHSTSSALMESSVGTICYSCPEIIMGSKYGAKADVWALGCLLYQMATLEPPFNTTNLLALAKRIVEGRYDPVPETRSEMLRNCVFHCLTADPDHRPNIVEVCDLIGPAILQEYDSLTQSIALMNEEIKVERTKRRQVRQKYNETEQMLKRLMSARQRLTSLSEEYEEDDYEDDDVDDGEELGDAVSEAEGVVDGSGRNGRGSRGPREHTPQTSARKGMNATSPTRTPGNVGSASHRYGRSASRSPTGSATPRSGRTRLSSVRSATRGGRPGTLPNQMCLPVTDLKPVTDPFMPLLGQLKKIMLVLSQPQSARTSPTRYVISRFQKLLFSPQTSIAALKDHLHKLSVGTPVPITDVDFGQAAVKARELVLGHRPRSIRGNGTSSTTPYTHSRSSSTASNIDILALSTDSVSSLRSASVSQPPSHQHSNGQPSGAMSPRASTTVTTTPTTAADTHATATNPSVTGTPSSHAGVSSASPAPGAKLEESEFAPNMLTYQDLQAFIEFELAHTTVDDAPP
eukprot:m.61885 g.61885  ORF g.61885 m.61885 type:complete len:1271 (-) comp11886_c1_seq1:380-4192(-)